MNVLLSTDVYKLGHIEQYPEDIEYIYSYLVARSDKKYKEYPFFGLQYYLKKYLEESITDENVDELLRVRKKILGTDLSEANVTKLRKLVGLDGLPLRIKAVPEGTIVRPGNVVMTIENTLPGYGFLVGMMESLVLKLWYPSTVAAASRKYKNLVTEYHVRTSDRDFLIPFLVHDFGFRGVSSEESAAIAGAAHLVNFLGTDTVPAVPFIEEYYGHKDEDGPIGLSVPASEHSVMCSFGPEREMEAFEHLLDLYPTGIVSIVSDTYDLWGVLTEILPALKPRILAREGKVVIRPDSGDPKKILLGDPASEDVRARKGVFRLLEELFGTTVNSKGFRELHPNIGVIYGDGMYYERFEDILAGMERAGLATDNLVIGVGGILLQQHNRDDLGFALKATSVLKSDGTEVALFKDPKTDVRKKSHKGRMVLHRTDEGFVTVDGLTKEQEEADERNVLQIRYINGIIVNEPTFTEVRDNAKMV